MLERPMEAHISSISEPPELTPILNQRRIEKSTREQ